MIGFHAILCMSLFQIAVVLGQILVISDEYCIYIHETTGDPTTDPAPKYLCATENLTIETGPAKVEIFAGFPGRSTKPKWKQTFALTQSGTYHFKKDYCLWYGETLIGCAKTCFDGGDDSFENPYDENNSKEPADTDPTHGNPPPNLPANQIHEFANTCIKSRAAYDPESQEPSPESISDAQIEDPASTQTDPDSDTLRDTGSEQPLVLPPSRQLFEVSSIPDSYDQPNTDSTSETSEPIPWEIFQRSVRKSPRDFRV